MFKRPEMLLLKQGILSEPHWGPISCIVVQVNTALRPKKARVSYILRGVTNVSCED